MRLALSVSLLTGVLMDRASSECGIYWAPSTIPGAGLGMFAGRDFPEQEQVTDGDIVIPIIDIAWHNNHENFQFLWDEYTWSWSTFDFMNEESESDDLTAASPGIGAMVNCILSLVNLEDTYSDFDNAGLHRASSPGAGAFTPYHNRRTKASRFIPAGQELYISYGANYFETRSRTYGNIPLGDNHYKAADKILDRMEQIHQQHKHHWTPNLIQDLWGLVRSEDSRAINALPANYSLELVEAIRQTGGTSQLYYNRSIHSLEFLEQNGKCMDNIGPGQSDIPHAGRGARATRFIPQGTLVAPAPLIHIPNKHRLTMYKEGPLIDGHIARDLGQPYHQQLMLNYCFGHRESTLLLCPYGMFTSLINHSKNPNTKLQWSSAMRHGEWMNRTVNDLKEESHAGLAFEYVALRDIQPGEEVTLDYGEEWVEAWNQHVQNWENKDPNYRAAFDLNTNGEVLKTMTEPGNYYSSTSVRQSVRNWYRSLQSSWKSPYDLLCRIVKNYERDGETLYMAEVYELEDVGAQTFVNVREVLFDLPRDAFVFFDHFYTRDHHMGWSFRHEIMVPDELFPKKWRNQKFRSGQK